MSEMVYVLMEDGWDYNDEVYFSSDGGRPSKVFVSKEAADAEAKARNLKEFQDLVRSGEIRGYAYSLNEICDDPENEIFYTLSGKSAEDWWDNPGDNLVAEPTTEQWNQLFGCFNLNFWSVVSVEKG